MTQFRLVVADRRSRFPVPSFGLRVLFDPDNLLTIWAWRLALAALVIGGWQAAAALRLVDPMFLASPVAVCGFLFDYVVSGKIWVNSLVTLEETVLGFALGAGLGILAGLVIGGSKFLERVLTPFLTIFNSLPRVALAPMFIIWFGIGALSKVVLAFSLVFFIVLISTEAGVRSIDPDLTMMAKVMGATDRQRFLKVVLHGAVPSIFAGLRLGAIYSLLGVVVGEMIAAKWGLGQQVMEYSYNYKPAGVFGVLAILALIAICLNELTTRIERHLGRWKTED